MVGARTLGEIAHAFIKVPETLDLNGMIRLWSPDCVQQINPKSMDYPEMDNARSAKYLSLTLVTYLCLRDPWGLDEGCGHSGLCKSYRAAYEAVLPYFDELKATIYYLITEETSNKVFIHASSTSKAIIDPYNNEYMFILHAVEDGTQSKMTEIYVDSFIAKEQNPRLGAAIAALKKEGASASVRVGGACKG